MSDRKKVCILVFSEIARDGRVLREVDNARKFYAVDVIAYGPWSAPADVHYFQLTKSTDDSFASNISRLLFLAAGKLNTQFFEQMYWQRREYTQAVKILQDGCYDLIHANDWKALPVAAFAKKPGTSILFDAHEYTPGQFTQQFTGRYLKTRYFEYLLRTYSKSVDAVITVSDGIAELYKQKFGWNAGVVRNAPKWMAVDVHPTHPSTIRLVHHGGAVPKRHLESLIHLIPMLDKRFSLTFILVASDKKYLTRLKALSNRLAPGRIQFRDPVPPASLPNELAAYDIGIHLLPAVNLNHMYALPNKLFDFIMAGLGVAIYPLPEMERIVREHQIGLISPDQTIEKMAQLLNRLSSEEVNLFKKNSLLLAKTLNGDVEMQKLTEAYAGLLAG